MDRQEARAKALELAIKSFGKDGVTDSQMLFIEHRIEKFFNYITLGRMP